jgi:hypothetical protein
MRSHRFCEKIESSSAPSQQPSGETGIGTSPRCPEVDIASQGEIEEEALANLKEAFDLHFELTQATLQPHLNLTRV